MPQDGAASFGGECPPFGLGSLGNLNGPTSLGDPEIRHRGHDRPVGRVHDVEGRSRLGLDPGPVDEAPVLQQRVVVQRRRHHAPFPEYVRSVSGAMTQASHRA